MSEVKQKKIDLKSFSLPSVNELKELDFNESGEWPQQIKILAIVIFFMVVSALGYFLLVSGKADVLPTLKNKESQLKIEYESKEAKAFNYSAYKHQLVDINKILNQMLAELPKKDEVSQLLIDISNAGLNNHLSFELFEPQKTIDAAFYMEIPIKIKVRGTYHAFGNFIAAITSLSRIVTVKNITIQHVKKKGSAAGDLVMELTAKTYQYKNNEADKKG